MTQYYNSLKSSTIVVDDGSVTAAKIAAGSITSSALYIPYSVINVGTTAQRPTTPVTGDIRLNTDTFYTETYYNSAWHNLNFLGTLPTETGVFGSFGGTVIQAGSKNRLHTFTTSGAFTIQGYAAGTIFQVLLIGGGGGGGGGSYNSGNGGGGGGGFLYTTLVVQSSASATYTVTVGNGGAVNASGQNSTIVGLSTNIEAIGGGAGGGLSVAASGGSGGGSRGNGSGPAWGLGTPGQGNRGGAGDYFPPGGNVGGGGGGGAGGVGLDGTFSGGTGGGGGPGSPNPVPTSTVGQLSTGVYYLSGGGGAGGTQATGAGGLGGGGAAGVAGTINTGGGGGNNSAGGSGAVIIQIL